MSDETMNVPEAGAAKSTDDDREVGLTRRALIVGGVGAAAMIAVGGVGKAVASDVALVRPPGAQSESALIGQCIKCDRCRSVCPTGAIDVAHIEDGLINARTPKMNFRKGYCDFCEGEFKCALSCPTQAISFGFDPLADRIGVAVVDTDECLLFRSGSGQCSKQCIAACRYDALSLDTGGHLVLNEDACNGCGACEHDCPSSSYASYTGSGKRGINVEVGKAGA